MVTGSMEALQLKGGQADPPALLAAMQKIRAVEMAVRDASLAGRFQGPVHVSLGQEGAAVGIGAALTAKDVMLSSHRGHGHALAFGLDPARVVAEIIGDPRGYSGGRGGSMHILDLPSGFLGTNGIVGDGAALAVGAALGLRRRGSQGVAIAIFGEGALGTGVAYESFNLASMWQLPVLFICESNGYAEMTPASVHLATPPIPRAVAFGLWTSAADGSEVMDVKEAVLKGLEQARAGSPAFVELRCHRWGGHYVGDAAAYRPVGEDEQWRTEHCPIARLADRLGHAPEEVEEQRSAFEAQARALIDSLVDSRPAAACGG